MAVRDTVESRRNGRITGRVPLVRLGDDSYEEANHLVLVDDAQRRLIQAALERERRHVWAVQLVTAIFAAMAGLSGVAALVLHFAEVHP